MKKFIVILIITLTGTIAAFSQELHLVVNDKPLNDVLRGLPVEISFDDNALSQYKVTVNRKFNNPQSALDFLLKDKPFRHENINGVYVIASYTEKIEQPPVVEVKRYYTFSGTIRDADSEEGLPYAYITTPEKTVSTDETGYFSFKTEKKGNQRVQVQYLGYQAQDTILSPGLNEIRLQSAVFTMDEVIVSPAPATMLIQSGNSPGEIRINHQISKYIPGSNDNSVFNLMRMMPGVRASGEPSEDLIVWGSNMGESKITYDGYTLFGIKNYNDHIGSVNPYMVKDIRILKGGYGSNQGGRIGAITEITGIDGNFNAPSVKATVSNYTMNLFASVPLTKKLNISAAYRQTFYNLYNNENVDLSNSENSTQTIYSSIYIKPDYHFNDANLKLSGKAFKDDSYYISLYGANDRFKYSVNQPNEYDVNASEKSRQYGGAASYKRVWENGSTTKVVATFSRLTSLLDNLTILGDKKPTTDDVSHLDNEVQEFSVKLNHDFNIGSRNKVQVGGEWQQYRVSLNELCGELDKPTVYITDNILLDKLTLSAGVRVDMPLNKKVYVQPRLSGTYKISEELTATASWGLYNQFLTRTAYQYDESGFQTVWTMADSTFTKAMHTTAGIAYSKNGFLVSMEGYYKTTKNSQYFLDNTVYKIDNTILGADLFAKKLIRNHTLYGSYSINRLSKPQNELSHEIKVGGIGAFDPFYFSLSYVYGTGFSYISTGGHGHGQGNEEGQHGSEHEHTDYSDEPYSRFDIGATYRAQIKKVRLQAGVSLLNVFGTKNIKYNYQISGQNTATNIFTKATPFTPTVFLEIIF